MQFKWLDHFLRKNFPSCLPMRRISPFRPYYPMINNWINVIRSTILYYWELSMPHTKFTLVDNSHTFLTFLLHVSLAFWIYLTILLIFFCRYLVIFKIRLFGSAHSRFECTIRIIEVKKLMEVWTKFYVRQT